MDRKPDENCGTYCNQADIEFQFERSFTETQTVEEYVFLEDDGYTRFVDREFTVHQKVGRCRRCGRYWAEDLFGGYVIPVNAKGRDI